MFETHDVAEVHVPPLLASNGERLWQYVALRLHMPWFYVIYKTTAASQIRSSSILFLQHPEQLIDLQQQAGIKIEQVELVSPGYMNGEGHWKMEPLREIWKGLEPGAPYEHEILIYVLDNGDRYANSSVHFNECDLIDHQLVFKICAL